MRLMNYLGEMCLRVVWGFEVLLVWVEVGFV